MMEKEIWKNIDGYSDLYEISSLGTIRSKDRVIRYKKNGKETIAKRRSIVLKPFTLTSGFQSIVLSKNGMTQTFDVHQLVCSAFCGYKPYKQCEVRHRDNDRSNNSASNLKWSDRSNRIEKICSNCGMKEISSIKYKKRHFCSLCKDESKRFHEYFREKYPDASDKSIHARVVHLRNHIFVKQYLENHGCVDCFERDTTVLEFDHIDRDTKISPIGKMVGQSSLEKLRKEVDKCEVRCANCHRRKTHSDLDWHKVNNDAKLHLFG